MVFNIQQLPLWFLLLVVVLQTLLIGIVYPSRFYEFFTVVVVVILACLAYLIYKHWKAWKTQKEQLPFFSNRIFQEEKKKQFIRQKSGRSDLGKLNGRHGQTLYDWVILLKNMVQTALEPSVNKSKAKNEISKEEVESTARQIEEKAAEIFGAFEQ